MQGQQAWDGNEQTLRIIACVSHWRRPVVAIDWRARATPLRFAIHAWSCLYVVLIEKKCGQCPRWIVPLSSASKMSTSKVGKFWIQINISIFSIRYHLKLGLAVGKSISQMWCVAAKRCLSQGMNYALTTLTYARAGSSASLNCATWQSWRFIYCTLYVQ